MKKLMINILMIVVGVSMFVGIDIARNNLHFPDLRYIFICIIIVSIIVIVSGRAK